MQVIVEIKKFLDDYINSYVENIVLAAGIQKVMSLLSLQGFLLVE